MFHLIHVCLFRTSYSSSWQGFVSDKHGVLSQRLMSAIDRSKNDVSRPLITLLASSVLAGGGAFLRVGGWWLGTGGGGGGGVCRCHPVHQVVRVPLLIPLEVGFGSNRIDVLGTG